MDVSVFHKLLSRFRKLGKPKVKLAAIAKDEAAYIPMWVFHHLRMGFDEIEIYTNLIEDNTLDVCRKISAHYPLIYRDADYIYESLEENKFQEIAYRHLREEARENGFAYLMFLDLDEFLCSTTPRGSINQCLSNLNYPDVVCFQWAMKLADNEEFSFPLNISNYLLNNQHVKTVFRSAANIEEIRIHNVVSETARYVLSDGTIKRNRGSPFVHKGQYSLDELRPYFVLHRIWRSQLEYVSRLGCPNRQLSPVKEAISFKDVDSKETIELELKGNRLGYEQMADSELEQKPIIHKIEVDELQQYEQDYMKFVRKCKLEESLAEARCFVEDRARMIMRALPEFKAEQPAKTSRLFKNVDIDALTRRLRTTKKNSPGL